ncbi:response regulator [Candidatus Woesearchaeota archaeon]|nr:response regulator [Candidatus Woesearchaeota archaeon]
MADDKRLEEIADSNNPIPKRILIADDDNSMLRLMVDIFQDEDYIIQTAKKGEGVLKALEEEEFDFVVTDLIMPDKSGEQLIRAIKKTGSPRPVVVVSGHGTIQEIERIKRIGVYDFLPKPFNVENLREIVRRGVTEIDEIASRLAWYSNLDKPEGYTPELNEELEYRRNARGIVAKGEKVLLVANTEQERDNLDNLLLDLGYCVDRTLDCGKALTMIEQTQFDVVLTDMTLSGGHGISVVDRAGTTSRARKKRTKVVVLSEYSDRENQLKTLKSVLLGASDVITKPRDIADLDQRVIKSSVWRALRLAKGSKSLRKNKVLVVGSDYEDLVKSLEKQKYKVDVVSGEEDVDEVKKLDGYHVVLLNERFGLDMLGKIKQTDPKIKALVLASKHLTPEEAVSSMVYGIDDVVYQSDVETMAAAVENSVMTSPLQKKAYDSINAFVKKHLELAENPLERFAELCSTGSLEDRALACCARSLLHFRLGDLESIREAINCLHNAKKLNPESNMPFVLYTNFVSKLPAETVSMLTKNLDDSLRQLEIKPYYFMRMRDSLLDEQKRRAEEEGYVTPTQPTRSKIMKFHSHDYWFYMKSAPLESMISYRNNINFFQRINRRYEDWRSLFGFVSSKNYKTPVAGFKAVITDAKEPFILEAEDGNAPVEPEVFNQLEQSKKDRARLSALLSACVRHAAYTCANGPIALAKNHVDNLEEFWEERLGTRVVEPIKALLKRKEISLDEKLKEEGRSLDQELEEIEKAFHESTHRLRKALAAQEPKGYYSDWWTSNAAVNSAGDVYKYGFLRTRSGLPIVVDLATVFHFRDFLSFLSENEEEKVEREKGYVKQFFNDYSEAVSRGINKIVQEYEASPKKFIIQEFEKDASEIRKTVLESEQTQEKEPGEEEIFFKGEHLVGLRYVSYYPSVDKIDALKKYFVTEVADKLPVGEYFTALKEYAKDKGDDVVEYVCEVERFATNLKPKKPLKVTDEILSHKLIPAYYNALCNRGMLMGGTLSQFTSEKLDKGDLNGAGIGGKLNDISLSFQNALRGIRTYHKLLSENPEYIPEEGEFENYQRLEGALDKLCGLFKTAKEKGQNEKS